jgi:hypothetical protein
MATSTWLPGGCSHGTTADRARRTLSLRLARVVSLISGDLPTSRIDTRLILSRRMFLRCRSCDFARVLRTVAPCSLKRRCDYECLLFSPRLWDCSGGDDCCSVQSHSTMHHERSSLRRGEFGVASGGTGLTITPIVLRANRARVLSVPSLVLERVQMAASPLFNEPMYMQ